MEIWIEAPQQSVCFGSLHLLGIGQLYEAVTVSPHTTAPLFDKMRKKNNLDTISKTWGGGALGAGGEVAIKLDVSSAD